MNLEELKKDYAHLLSDQTPIADIDTSGSASRHELGDLTDIFGHASLASYPLAQSPEFTRRTVD
jgi:hypothetical protein